LDSSLGSKTYEQLTPPVKTSWAFTPNRLSRESLNNSKVNSLNQFKLQLTITYFPIPSSYIIEKTFSFLIHTAGLFCMESAAAGATAAATLV
jgi:hypothetical protein